MTSVSATVTDGPPVSAGVVGLVAAGAVALLGLRLPLGGGLTAGLATGLALAPLWLPEVRRQWGGSALVLLGITSASAGVWLTARASVDHSVDTTIMVSTTLLLLSVVVGAGVVAWARSQLGTGATGAWFGVGLLLSELTGSGRVSDNPWKYAYAVPLAVIVLSLAERRGSRRLEVVLLALLVAVSAGQASRSYAAEFALAAILVLWQVRPTGRNRSSMAATTALLVAAGVAVYNLGITLLLDGYLGEKAQQRSVEQVDAAGSLLLGGRPEISATVALFQDRPLGFGSGVAPGPSDIGVAKGAMAAVGYDPGDGYVESYMFNGQFKLHSVTGDLWVSFGLVGLALAVLIAVIIVRGLVVRVTEKRASAIVAYLSCLTLWNLVFSPLYTSAASVTLCLGLLLLPRGERRARTSSPPAHADSAAADGPLFRGR